MSGGCELCKSGLWILLKQRDSPTSLVILVITISSTIYVTNTHIHTDLQIWIMSWLKKYQLQGKISKPFTGCNSVSHRISWLFTQLFKSDEWTSSDIVCGTSDSKLMKWLQITQQIVILWLLTNNQSLEGNDWLTFLIHKLCLDGVQRMTNTNITWNHSVCYVSVLMIIRHNV